MLEEQLELFVLTQGWGEGKHPNTPSPSPGCTGFVFSHFHIAPPSHPSGGWPELFTGSSVAGNGVGKGWNNPWRARNGS